MIEAAFPMIEDLSLEGRRRYVAQWGDRLWAFWREQLELAIISGEIDPRPALGRGWEGSASDAASSIAEKLLQAMRERPTFAQPPQWEAVRRWFAWLVGRQAMVAARQRTVPLRDDHAVASPEDGHPAGDRAADERRAALEALVREWADLLARVVAATGVTAIEADWLWATLAPRRILARYLAQVGASAGPFVLTSAKVLSRATSSPGPSKGARIARTRAGAAACLRFNLAAWRDVGGLADAVRVFLGPAAHTSPYRPSADVDGATVVSFRTALELAADARAATAGATGVGRLRADVAARAFRKSVLRLLPRPDEDRLASAWSAMAMRMRSR